MKQTNVRFLKRQLYPGAHHPLYHSRARELKGATEYAKAFGFEISEADFDQAIAEKFGDGCEYEWPRD